MRCLHNLLTDLDFEWCDKGETGRPIGCLLCVYASVCECVSGRTACARLKGAMSSLPGVCRCIVWNPYLTHHLFFSLSLFHYSVLSLFVRRQHGGPNQGRNKRGQGIWAGKEGETHSQWFTLNNQTCSHKQQQVTHTDICWRHPRQHTSHNQKRFIHC